MLINKVSMQNSHINFKNREEQSPKSAMRPIHNPITTQPLTMDSVEALKGLTVENSHMLDYIKAANFLKDLDGKVDKKSMQNFVTIYNVMVDELEYKNASELEFLEAQSKIPSGNISEFQSDNETLNRVAIRELVNKENKGDDFEKNVIQGLSGDIKKDLVEHMKEFRTEEFPRQIPQKAFEMTKRIFELSKCDNGDYDFSDIQRKVDIIEGIDSIYGSSTIYDDDDVYLTTIAASKENGKVNLEKIEDMVATVKSTAFIYDPDYVIEMQDYFYSKAIDNKQKISDTINFLNNKTMFDMDSENNNFETLLELCFDEDGKFSEDRAELLKESSEKMSDWLCEKTQYDSSHDQYNINKRLAFGAITSYFTYIDEGQNISFDEFIETKIAPLLKI